MSKKGKHQNTSRNWVARQMIIDRIGVNASAPMKDRRNKREKDYKNSWKNESWGDE
jgi:hypothetical protein